MSECCLTPSEPHQLYQCREQLSFMWDDDEDDVDDDDYGCFLLDQHESTICRTRSEHTKPLHLRCG